jgi:hypothetical protein
MSAMGHKRTCSVGEDSKRHLAICSVHQIFQDYVVTASDDCLL